MSTEADVRMKAAGKMSAAAMMEAAVKMKTVAVVIMLISSCCSAKIRITICVHAKTVMRAID